MRPLFALLLAGCGDPASKPAPPTWSQDVAPLVQARCGSCHVEGGAGPSFETYAAAAPLASAMAAAVEAGTMPPWRAIETDECQPRLPYKDDLRLTDDEKALLSSWAEAGAPEGDPAKAGPLPEAPDLALARVDQELWPEIPYSSSGEDDEFLCFVLDPGLDQTRWLTGLQVQPGNAEVVHHVLVFTDPDGRSLDLADEEGRYECFGSPGISNTSLVGAWAPGAVPMNPPEGAGIEVAAGSLMVMQVHYHPRGQAADPDQTTIQLRWEDEEPARKAVLALLGNADNRRQGLQDGPNDEDGRPEFRIPAGASGHTETIVYNIGEGEGPYTIWSSGTHMHYIGTEMLITVDHAAPQGDVPERECLVQTTWDFNWQRSYAYDADFEDLPTLRGGDVLTLRCTYDNTLDNPGAAAALEDAGLSEPIDVTLGEETLDEMCLGVFGIIYE